MSDQEGKSSTQADTGAVEHPRGEKRNVDETEEVNSANNWEKVDLGGDERKQKFLRLMGASKKEHRGRFVIGEKEQYAHHGNSETEVKKMTTELESQFQQGVDMKLTGASRQHRGFGFHVEEPVVESSAKPLSFVKAGDKEGAGDNEKEETPEAAEADKKNGEKKDTEEVETKAGGSEKKASETESSESKGPVQVPDISESS